MRTPADSVDTGVERLLRRDRVVVIACLAAVMVLAWLYLALLAGDTARGEASRMGLASAGEVSMALQEWTATTFVLMLAMWWIMMIGMMIPSAAPAILIFARAQRQQLADECPVCRTLLFTFGYLLAWLAFSALATTLQWRLGEAALLSPMMTSTTPVLGAITFAAAGLYQLTPLKHACLAHCRSPLHFLAERWRRGNRGALRMGASHGAYCVGLLLDSDGAALRRRCDEPAMGRRDRGLCAHGEGPATRTAGVSRDWRRADRRGGVDDARPIVGAAGASHTCFRS